MPESEAAKKWTVIELINWTTEYLKEKDFDNSRLQVERLLGHTFGFDRVKLYLNFDRPLMPDELAKFKSLLKRRLNHEPLQYIIGESEFMSLPFRVAPGVLIPRPETEILVEKCMEYIKQCFPDQQVKILDIGTGCGNIAVSLAKYLENAIVTAIDISQKALNLAVENGRINNVSERIDFKLFNIHDEIPEIFRHAFNVVVSNPPYIRQNEFALLVKEIRDFEPKEALLAGEDGLVFYQRISNLLDYLFAEKSCAFFEIGEDMSGLTSKIFQCKNFKTTIFNDLSGKDRVVRVQR